MKKIKLEETGNAEIRHILNSTKQSFWTKWWKFQNLVSSEKNCITWSSSELSTRVSEESAIKYWEERKNNIQYCWDCHVQLLQCFCRSLLHYFVEPKGEITTVINANAWNTYIHSELKQTLLRIVLGQSVACTEGNVQPMNSLKKKGWTS